MKKLLASLLAALTVVLMFSGCGAEEPSSSASEPSSQNGNTRAVTPDEESYRFGYSAVTMNNPFFVYIENVMREIIESNGDELITTDPQQDTSKQISQVEDLVTQGIDVLMLCPVDSEGIRPALEAANAAGVVIINFDNNVSDTELVDCILVSNNVNAGYVVGQKVLEDFPEGANIAILHNPTAQSSIDRVTGFRNAIAEAGNASDYIEVAEQDGKASTQDSLPVAENILQANPDLDLFFCINDASAIGAVAALKATDKTGDVLVYGIDGAPEGKNAINDGEMAATGAQSPKSIAEASVDTAYKILAGQEVEHEILVDTFLIDDTNVSQYGLDSWQ